MQPLLCGWGMWSFLLSRDGIECSEVVMCRWWDGSSISSCHSVEIQNWWQSPSWSRRWRPKGNAGRTWRMASKDGRCTYLHSGVVKMYVYSLYKDVSCTVCEAVTWLTFCHFCCCCWCVFCFYYPLSTFSFFLFLFCFCQLPIIVCLVF